jgi:hypothetical protein
VAPFAPEGIGKLDCGHLRVDGLIGWVDWQAEPGWPIRRIRSVRRWSRTPDRGSICRIWPHFVSSFGGGWADLSPLTWLTSSRADNRCVLRRSNGLGQPVVDQSRTWSR